MKVSNSIALGAAVAGLVAGSVTLTTSSKAFAAGADKVDCYNSCGGHKLGKKTAASCAGTISAQMSAKACKKAGGTTTKPSAGGASGETTPAAGATTPAQDSGAAPAAH